MTDKPFAGKLALVTGASRGIGTAIAEALGRTGAHVIITARTSGGLEEVEERIHAAGGSATIAPLDLTDGDSIGRLAGAVAERWNALDILVLNAAMLRSEEHTSELQSLMCISYAFFCLKTKKKQINYHYYILILV